VWGATEAEWSEQKGQDARERACAGRGWGVLVTAEQGVCCLQHAGNDSGSGEAVISSKKSACTQWTEAPADAQATANQTPRTLPKQTSLARAQSKGPQPRAAKRACEAKQRVGDSQQPRRRWTKTGADSSGNNVARRGRALSDAPQNGSAHLRGGVADACSAPLLCRPRDLHAAASPWPSPRLRARSLRRLRSNHAQTPLRLHCNLARKGFR